MAQQTILEAWAEWVTELAQEIAKNLEDKKFTFVEGLALLDNALKLPKLIRRSKEFKGLEVTEQMKHELVAKFAAKFDLVNDKAEALTELCLDILLTNISLGLKIAKIVKKDKEK